MCNSGANHILHSFSYSTRSYSCCKLTREEMCAFAPLLLYFVSYKKLWCNIFGILFLFLYNWDYLHCALTILIVKSSVCIHEYSEWILTNKKCIDSNHKITMFQLFCFQWISVILKTEIHHFELSKFFEIVDFLQLLEFFLSSSREQTY